MYGLLLFFFIKFTPLFLHYQRFIQDFPMDDFKDIQETLSFLDTWEDRYSYIIDLGRHLPPYPEKYRSSLYKVQGCASQVWLYAEYKNKSINLYGDSDAQIVKGLIALLISLYKERSPEEILSIDPYKLLSEIDLENHLTSQRSNGLSSMIKRIKALAQSLC